MENFTIRPCTTGDLNEVKRLFTEFVDWHKSLDESFIKTDHAEDLFTEYVADNLKNNKSRILVAETGNGLAGYIFGQIMNKPPVYREPRYGYVDNLAVDSRFQRRGIGTTLFKNLLSWFEAEEVTRIEIFAAVKNPKSTNFWRTFGFEPYTEQMYLNTGD